jgi:23S rRNA (uracil1939-C5)-methyltransferase
LDFQSIFAIQIERVRKNRNKPFYEQVTITDIGAEGKSIGRVGEKIIFTTHAIPGDIVDLQVIRKKKKYEEAVVVYYHHYSIDRETPFCQHFGICGGCKWQYLPYALQLKFKQKQVADQLVRIGKLELPSIDPILGSPNTTFYRNKLEFTFSNDRWLTPEEISSQEKITNKDVLGFHIPGMFDKIFPVIRCWLQPEPSNAIRNYLFDYGILHHLPFFDLRNQTGFLRTIIVRTSSTGEVMVVVTFFMDNPPIIKELLNALNERFPEITSLMYVINSKGNDTITDQEIRLFSGKPYITEEMDGILFRIGPKSFFQTNTRQALGLYRKIREFAALDGNEVVYDLYTGTGTIANFMARYCKKVIGIEYVPEAIEDAKVNSIINQIGNTCFFDGDIKNILQPAFIQKHGRPDVIITDPPRSGMHEDVIRSIMEASPDKIIYVSCNPATQARDLALMSQIYTICRVQPVDMFPHTHHVENIVLLQKKSEFGTPCPP